MKKVYQAPQIEIILFDTKDIITTSDELDIDKELFEEGLEEILQ